MFVTDARKEFFEQLLNEERVLIVCNMDVDAICAVKILQTLLQFDHVSYTLVPITCKADLIKAFNDNVQRADQDQDHEGKVKKVVMINCGCTFDLVDFFHPPDDVIFFIVDSHRPINVYNVYNDGQVRLITRSTQSNDIPEYHDIFRDSSDEEDEDEEDEDSQSQPEGSLKRPRFDEAAIVRRQERRNWEANRAKVLFEYDKYTFYGPSTAVLMYDLALKMSKESNDLLWWAIVGHTEQWLMLKASKLDDDFVAQASELHAHVSRLNHRAETESTSINCMKVSCEQDLNLNLFRHWSLYESLHHTIYTAGKFRIWTMKGKQKLSEFLAELGLPLVQCKQKFTTMDLKLRSNIVSVFEEKSAKYGLDEISYNSFQAVFGFRNKFSASDVVFSCWSIMEHHLDDLAAVRVHHDVKIADSAAKTPTDFFMEALDSLSRCRIDLLECGIENAKHRLSLVMTQVQNLLDLRTVSSAGPFLYAIIQDGTPDCKAFSKPNTLAMLAHFTLRAYLSVAPRKKYQHLPLVISAPFDTDKGTCLVLGVPPVSDLSRRNLLGTAFEKAIKKTGSRYLPNYFDSSVILLRTEDRSKFFDGLISTLTT